ncbi:MAG: preprotein translocase subunit SecG [Oscillospiraceae bacterium]|nr:preprotein translocase subunit SecG [Oscillospiraceae bacterium]
MGIFEIISAIVLIVACVFIVVVVLMKETKTQMSQTISGTSSDSFYQKNSGRTKEAMLNKATITAAVIFFVLAVGVNVINVYFGGSKDNTNSQINSSVSDDVSDVDDLSGIDLTFTVEAEDEPSAPATAE